MKKNIPKALRDQVWKEKFGEVFKRKCPVQWCQNIITVFDFEVGHNIPESKGGDLSLFNLLPICNQCNRGMGNRFTIQEWSDQVTCNNNNNESNNEIDFLLSFQGVSVQHVGPVRRIVLRMSVSNLEFHILAF